MEIDNKKYYSMRACIDRFCLQCKHNDPWAVGNCDNTECQLNPVRPNKMLLGTEKDKINVDGVVEEINDIIKFIGLKKY